VEFIVKIKVDLPGDMPDEQRAALQKAEAERAAELAAEGHLVRLWRIIGRRENWGLWRAKDGTELHAALSSLPMFPYRDIEVVPLARHPVDPAPPSS